MILDKISQLYNLGGKCDLDFFVYVAHFPIGTFVGNATIIVNVPIQADSDFLLRALSLVSYTAPATPLASPDYMIQIFDTGSGRALSSATVHVGNMCGTAQLPFILPEPRLFSAGGVVQVTLVNNTAVASLVDVGLIGFKVFYKAGYNRSSLGTM